MTKEIVGNDLWKEKPAKGIGKVTDGKLETFIPPLSASKSIVDYSWESPLTFSIENLDHNVACDEMIQDISKKDVEYDNK